MQSTDTRGFQAVDADHPARRNVKAAAVGACDVENFFFAAQESAHAHNHHVFSERERFFGHFINQLGAYKIIGAFIAGMFFTSIFTTAPALATLGELGLVHNPVVIAIIGGLGAVIGDMVIFKFVRDRFVQERNRRKITTRNLWEREISKKTFKEYYEERSDVKIIPEIMHNRFETSIFIYDDKTLYISSKKNCYAILITSEEHTKTMSAIFDGIWSDSIKKRFTKRNI
jgi:hypothetical protein